MSSKSVLIVMLLLTMMLAACGSDEKNATDEATDVPATTQAIETSEPETTPEATDIVAVDEDTHPYLGINFDPNNPNGFEIFVDPDSPAEKGGIEDGDILLGVNSQSVTPNNIGAIFADFQVGDVVTLTVRRGEEEQDHEVTLEAAPEVETPVLSITQPFAGIIMRVDSEQVTIDELMPGSPAEAAGLQPGDVIIEANGVSLDEPNQVFDTVQGLLPGMELNLTVLRDAEPQEFSLVLAAPSGDEQQNQTQSQVVLTDSIDFLDDEGVYLVESAPEDGILARISLEEGDRIVSIDGEVLQPEELFSRVNQTTPEDIIRLEVERDGSRVVIDAPGFAMPTLATAAQINEAASLPGAVGVPQQPGSNPQNLPSFINPSNQNNNDGSTESQLPPFLRSQGGTQVAPNFPPLTNANQLGIIYNQLGDALVVTSTIPGSPAQSAGIMDGDVITAINGEEVADAAELQNKLEEFQGNIVISIQRSDETLDIEINVMGNSEQEVPGFFGAGGPPIPTNPS